jgi:hypothetical protein
MHPLEQLVISGRLQELLYQLGRQGTDRYLEV